MYAVLPLPLQGGEREGNPWRHQNISGIEYGIVATFCTIIITVTITIAINITITITITITNPFTRCGPDGEEIVPEE